MAAARILFTVEVIVYALLSFADLILTTFLLRFGGGGVYESNPIARSWLESFGWKGLITFKLVSSTLVAFVSLVIYYYRPRLGMAIIALGCLVMGIVVAYSSNLLDKISKESVAGGEVEVRSSSEFSAHPARCAHPQPALERGETHGERTALA